jgi:protein gp37
VSDKSAIEWTDATWNPVTGCTKVSPGCDHCYAETFAERWRGVPGHYFEDGFDVRLRSDKLDLPLRWQKPRKVFVNSMSDLFHPDVPDDYVARVFAVMALAPQHAFQVLTKRHGRMRSLLNNRDWWAGPVAKAAAALDMHDQPTSYTPPGRSGYVVPVLRNCWLGVSVEDQKRAELRVPALLGTPAVIRWISAEPLLGPVDLSRWLRDEDDAQRLNWVVVGGESGRNARPIDPEWVRHLRDQCGVLGVPFLFKQWGGRSPKANGRELDGRSWDEFPQQVTV